MIDCLLGFFITLLPRPVDPHSFFADPDPAVFLNADLDPAAFLMWIRIELKQICESLPYEEFTGVEKDNKNGSKI